MTGFDRIALGCGVALISIWLVYPLGIALAAAFRRKFVPPQSADLPLVSVVLATSGAEDDVWERVDDIVRAAEQGIRLEVIVARDRAAPALTRLGVQGAVPVHIVSGDEPGGKSAALNAGVRAARGELLVFADTAQRFAPDAIARLAQYVATGPYAIASGRLVFRQSARNWSPIAVYWRLESRLRCDEAQLQSSVGVTGAIYAMRRTLWSPLPAGLLLDDVFVPMHAVLRGHRVGYVRDAVAIETRPLSPDTEFRRKVRTLTGVIQLVAWMPRSILPVRNPLWIQFIFHKVLRLTTPYLIVTIAAWALTRLTQWGIQVPDRALAAAAALGLGILLSVLAGRRPLQSVRRALVWGVSLQAAVVVGTMNGLRGRWNVWGS